MLGISRRLGARAGWAILAGTIGLCGCSVDATDLFAETGGSSGEGGAAATTSTSSTTTTSGATSTTGAGGQGTGGGGADCGNGVAEPGEACDGADFAGQSCTSFGYSNPAGLACDAGCVVSSAGCSATCDLQLLEPGEVCDGVNLGGQSCVSFGFSDPNGLACDNCQLVSTGCAATCDGVALEVGEVCDGTNLAGGSCTSFGFANPGGLACTGCALDPAGCQAVCGNGVLEPTEGCEDGNTANGDGCSSTCQAACASTTPVALALGAVTLTGSTVGGGSHEGMCQSDGPDRIYAVTPSAAGFLTASLTRGPTNFDSVLYVATSCSDVGQIASRLCVDSYDVINNQALDGGETLSVRVQQGETYYVVVDGWDAGESGDYQLVLDLSTGASCADPVPFPLYDGAPMEALGSNVGFSASNTGSCGGFVGGEVIYAVTRALSGSVDVETNTSTNYNAVLYARSSCSSGVSEIDCSNQGGGALESITIPSAMAGVPFFVRVDGSTAGGGSASGNYGLTVTP